jgi:hypothetical protein
MKTLNNQLPIVISAVVVLFAVGFLAPEFIRFEGSEAYANTRPPKGTLLECPDACRAWEIYLDDFGYSDYLGYSYAGVPMHEMLCGEWAAAIKYAGIETWPKAMWLTDQFICPDWITNSLFWVVQPMMHTGPNQVTSIIQNSRVQIEIIATMYCSQTAMGITADPNTGNFVVSDSCFMVQDYIITNISGAAIESLYFCQFLHGHPGDIYDPVVVGVYDSDFYPIVDPEFPMSQNYHYDITMWADVTWGEDDYTEYIGFGAIERPTTYDVWHYRGDCLAGRPLTGLHVRQEDNNLQNVSSWGPDETAGAEEWFLGTLHVDHSDTVSVLLSVGWTPGGQIPTLTEWGLIIFGILLLGFITWVFLRRKREVVSLQ